MLPLRANNFLSPAVYNGLSSIGTDMQGRSYQDKLFVKSFAISLTPFQTSLNNQIQLDKDADFNWLAVSIQATNNPFSVRFSDSTGFQISDGFIGSFAFVGSTGIGAPFVLPRPLNLPAGSSIIIDITDQSGNANGPITFLIIGLKRFYGTQPDEIAYKARVNNFVDGWAINPAVYPNPYTYQWLCIEAMQSVRVANNFRPKIYAIPDQSTIPARANPITTNAQAPGMTPFSTYTTQVRMLPGTYVLGMSLTVLVFVAGAPGVYEATVFQEPDNFYVTCSDDATGIPFFSDWPAELAFNIPVLWQGQGLLPPFINRQVYVAKSSWLPLTRPRPILTPGVVTVNMCSKYSISAGYNIAPQLMLMCAEPCGNGGAPTVSSDGGCQ